MSAHHVCQCRSTIVPIEDRTAEWTGRARSSEEDIPDVVSELLRLRIGTEGWIGSPTAQTDCDQLSLGLAGLDSGGQELTVREICAGEGASVPVRAGLFGQFGIMSTRRIS